MYYHFELPLPIRYLRIFQNPHNDLPSSVHGLLRATRHDAPIHLFSEWDAPVSTNLSLLSGDDRIVLSPLETMRIYRGVRLQEPTGEKPSRSFAPLLREEAVVNTSFKPGFLKQATYFIDTCVLGLKSSAVGCTLKDEYNVTRLCEVLTGVNNQNSVDISAVH